MARKRAQDDSAYDDYTDEAVDRVRRGAGGNEGGTGRFFLGLIMMVAGGYLFFDSIQIINHFRWGGAFFSVGGVGITGGLVLIPFLFGIGFIFYNARNPLGWLLAISTLVMLGVGVISRIDFRMQRMSAFELLMILGLGLGGVGLFLSSLKPSRRP